MHLMNGFEVLKTGVLRYTLAKPGVVETRDADIALLGALAMYSRKMVARNGRSYWYYTPRNEEHMDVVRFLMMRNGLVPVFRMSRYGSYDYSRVPSYRVSCAYLARHQDLSDFVDSIRSGAGMGHSDDVNARVAMVRQQMGQKTK